MARIGLQNGDSIIAINGRNISEHSHNSIRALYLEHHLILQIKRDGERRVLYWQVPVE
jgi:type II secretory pathway component PulC